MQHKLSASFLSLKSYCEKEEFKGWDPYDGLNSKLFQLLPVFKKSAWCRLLVIQGFKRFPINLRRLAFVPKRYNTKGLGLFLTGYCNLYRCQSVSPALSHITGEKEEIIKHIRDLSELLIDLQSEGYSGACWGYDFDWQSKAFFLPAGTPTVVATSFVVEALLNAFEITRNERYLTVALSSADFILKDLNRIPKTHGYMFSYSPLDRRAVYNATLLGTKTLSLIYSYTHDEALRNAAYASAKAVCDKQNPDGSFPHSDQIGNKWRDNFHTGFKLESLACFRKYCENDDFSSSLAKGYAYWINHFFLSEPGIAKYYDRASDLIDLHCVAQAIPTLFKTGKLMEQATLANRLLQWAIENMQDSRQGYFYFQKKGNSINKIAYMRWPNAWMFYGMSYWLLFDCEHENR